MTLFENEFEDGQMTIGIIDQRVGNGWETVTVNAHVVESGRKSLVSMPSPVLKEKYHLVV